MASSSLSKAEQSTTDTVFSEEREPEEQQEEWLKGVTSHVVVMKKPTAESLDRDVVLRRIRHRKRINRVRSAIQSFVPARFLASSESEVSGLKVRWVDDAFAAP